MKSLVLPSQILLMKGHILLSKNHHDSAEFGVVHDNHEQIELKQNMPNVGNVNVTTKLFDAKNLNPVTRNYFPSF
jgi:hypothetical protein